MAPGGNTQHAACARNCSRTTLRSPDINTLENTTFTRRIAQLCVGAPDQDSLDIANRYSGCSFPESKGSETWSFPELPEVPDRMKALLGENAVRCLTGRRVGHRTADC